MLSVITEVVRPGITLVTLTRPERLNALRLEDLSELITVLDGVALDEHCRAVVLTGAGRGFCSGHDLADSSGELTVSSGLAVVEAFSGLTKRVRSLPQPVVAAVNGPATGAGFALALAADIRIATPSARFSSAFVRLGLSGCECGVSYLLPKIVGPTLAFEMMLTGRLVDADEAHLRALVARIVPEGTIVEEAIKIAEVITANSPFGVRMTKEVMWSNLDAPSLESAIALEDRTQMLCAGTADHREAVRAFFEHRPASFSNR
jgi:enoyl-CoA hydratase